jgi:hypothetical protein
VVERVRRIDRRPLPAAECRFREAHNAPAEISQKQQFSPRAAGIVFEILSVAAVKRR